MAGQGGDASVIAIPKDEVNPERMSRRSIRHPIKMLFSMTLQIKVLYCLWRSGCPFYWPEYFGRTLPNWIIQEDRV
jgi:hypothetical protein